VVKNVKNPIYAVVGPTASGKSDLGIALALRIGGEIINCDSVQIYKEIEAEARVRGVVPETLVNLWLAEKLQASK